MLGPGVGGCSCQMEGAICSKPETGGLGQGAHGAPGALRRSLEVGSGCTAGHSCGLTGLLAAKHVVTWVLGLPLEWGLEELDSPRREN